MRTRVAGDWVVGHENGRHILIRNGEVIYEGDKILFVGSRFEGSVDQHIDASGTLVAPGLIDTHVHAGYQAQKRLITDVGRPDYFGQPFLEFDVARMGTTVGGDPRFFSEEDKERQRNDPWALFTAVELLRNGVTSFVEMGAPVHMQEQLAAAVDRLGTRAWLGAGYDLGGWAGGPDGRLTRVIDEAQGAAAFDSAVAFSKRIDGTSGGRVHAILAPKRAETCSIEQLTQTAALAREHRFPVCIHAAYSVHEFYDIVREHQKTPIQFLDHVGLLDLGPTLNIGHGNFVAEHRRLAYSGGRDIDLLGEHGSTISHCACNLVRRARFLDTWTKYRRAGVNVALGSDTYPRDMFMQMRTASYFAKVLEHDLTAASAAEVFDAATVAGARSLARDDLGRLEPGAKADIITIDLRSLRHGPVRDPIRSVVECGIGDDVRTVIVGGRVCMRDRRIDGVDDDDLLRAAQAVGERTWSRWQDWDTLGRTADEMCPMSYPVASASAQSGRHAR
jgi:5-methylthioadenosine/S-adenosylhomocysteine deaminase